jgi:hypothetical protein
MGEGSGEWGVSQVSGFRFQVQSLLITFQH